MRGRIFPNLEAKHACDEPEAVLHPMIHLPDQKLMPFKRGLQIALVPFALDRHSENVRRALQECEIVLDELTAGPAVDLQHPEGPAVALQDDVHRAKNAMSDKDLRRFEALFDLEMVGDDGSAGFESKSGRRSEIGVDFGDAHNTRLPADAGANHKSVFGRKIFEHLAKLGSQAFRGQARRIGEKLVEPRSLQRADAELGQDFLLANALAQGAKSRI